MDKIIGTPSWDRTGGYRQTIPHTTVMPGRSTDDEASALLDELTRLQSLMVMQCQRGPEWISAADLVQRTRVLIIERCKKPSRVEPEA